MLSLVDRHRFERLVREHKAERGAKSFSCCSQFVAMMFCQLARAKSLREIIDGLACCEGTIRHLGLEASPKRSTLSYANGRRPWNCLKRFSIQSWKWPGHPRPVSSCALRTSFSAWTRLSSSFAWRCSTGQSTARPREAIKLHMLLDHDGYLPIYAYVTEGNVPEIEIARALSLPKGSIVVMDRGYIDYKLFSRWTKEGIRFVTRLHKR
jgi:Domain of unknown function (DUF4372)/Transposase DDE domain